MTEEANNKEDFKKGEAVYIVNGLSVTEGKFVSESNSYIYIEVGNGVVLGYIPKTVFKNKVDALENLNEILKQNIYYYLKTLSEKLPLKDIDKIVDAISKIKKLAKK